MVTERQIAGGMKIKEMETRITEKPDSTENITTVVKRATGRLIFGQRIKKKSMASTTSLCEPHFVEKSQKMTTKKTSKNG